MTLKHIGVAALASVAALTGTAIASSLKETTPLVDLQTITVSAAGTATSNAKVAPGTRLSFRLAPKLTQGQTVKVRLVPLKADTLKVRSDRRSGVVSARVRPGKTVEIGVTPLLRGVSGQVTLTITSVTGRAVAIDRKAKRPLIIISRPRVVVTTPTTTATPPVTTAGDTTAPTAPTGVVAAAATRTSLSISWTAATDDTGVTGYLLSRGGTQVATPSGTSQTLDQLDCGTAYAIGVKAKDAAGNVGPEATASLSTSPCPVVMNVGDIACATPTSTDCRQQLVADVVNAQNPDAFINNGDAQYDDWASASAATGPYNTAFGSLLPRTWTVQGNHDFDSGAGLPSANATGASWYNYFGPLHAGPAYGEAWSKDLGTWHLVFLNSNCRDVTGAGQYLIASCAAQNTWLQNDLAATRQPCILASWHHPRYAPAASLTVEAPGGYADNPSVGPWWNSLYAKGSDVVLNGHSHNYQVLAPIAPDKTSDTTKGIREFIVGTGGRVIRPTNGTPFPIVATGNVQGALKLTLKARSYDWSFIPVAGSTFTDSGTGDCHTKS